MPGRRRHSPTLVEFHRLHPEIELQLIVSDQWESLTQRHADVALRATRRPGDTLIGHKIGPIGYHVYASPSYLERRDESGYSHSFVTWADGERTPPWVAARFAGATCALRVNSLLTMAMAVQDGYGLGLLPCAIGDTESGLVRVNDEPPEMHYDLWLLNHRDLRHTHRIRVFSRFVLESLRDRRGLLAGLQ